MTLYKQIVIGIISLFILLISSVFIIEFNTTRNNLEQQQHSEVNNTINTIGLALSPYLEKKDIVAVESVINALFDGSSYSRIRLVYLDDNTEIFRQYPLRPSNVPKWFSSFHLFKQISEKRIITSGWRQLAEIEIVSQPGEAYKHLWDALIRFSIVFCCVFIFGLIAIALIIKHALKPLRAITIKMGQVARSQFGDSLPKPATKDLITLVDGINKMSTQIERTFIAQAKDAQELRNKAYIDPVSSLGNRPYFINQLNNWAADGGYGVIGLLHATFIEHTYQELGYQAGDKQVRELANLLKTTINISNLSIARISESEIAFIFENMEEDEVDNIAEIIIDSVSSFTSLPFRKVNHGSYLGLVYSETSKTSSDFLSLLDNALALAKSNRDFPYGYISSEENKLIMGKLQWKSLVEEAIENDQVIFRYQKVVDKKGNTQLHQEVFSAIDRDGQKYSATQYLFALEQQKVSYLFDKYIIRTIVDQLTSKQLTGTIAINIAPSSVEEPSFIYWLGEVLQNNKEIAGQLHFELPESCFINIPNYTTLFCNTIRQGGADFGVDDFGSHFDSLTYLNQFRPCYVKIDYLFTHHLDNETQRETLTSISRAAHDLDIVTIASRVETQAQLDFLTHHFIDMFQGFAVDK